MMNCCPRILLKSASSTFASITLAFSLAVQGQNTLFEADFETTTDPTVGSADYNVGSTTAIATLVPVASGPDTTLENQVLLLDGNGSGTLAARFDLSSPATLQGNTITIEFDLVARRTNGSSKTTLLSGFSSLGDKVFTLVLGDTDAFGNGINDRQRPGYATASSNKTLFPGATPPSSFWWGSDTTPDSLNATKDARFTLTIGQSSWEVDTTDQNNLAFSSGSLPHFDGQSHNDVAYLTLESETGTSFGQYWDNLTVTSGPSSTPLENYFWTGDGDGVSLYQEANWNENSDGSGTNIPQINPGNPVNATLVANSGSLGGVGATGNLLLGTGSLTLNGGTLTFAAGRGINGGSLTVNNSASQVTAAFLTNSNLNTSAGATVNLSGAITNTPVNHSGGNLTAASLASGSDATLSFGSITLTSTTPFDGSTLDFVGSPSGTLTLTSLDPTAVANNWLASLTVAGTAAIASGPSQNITISPDGSGGSLISRFIGLTDSDNDQMDDNWETLNFGNLDRDGTADLDGDGLNDLDEYLNGTFPQNGDSDDDLLSDGLEVNTYQTDPLDSDSDDDSNPDGFEISKGTDPKDAASKTNRPNILFIFADDLGYGDLGVLFQNAKSGKKHKTPFFDQMAADGLILDRHYCPAPVCAPSRGSLLTGMHQGHANIRDNQFDKALENNHNLANVLKQAGYSTNIIGKWGLQGNGGSPTDWPAYPTKRGFDYFFGYVRHVDGHTHYPDHVTASRGLKELYDQDQMIRDDLDKCFTPDLFTARAKKLIIDEVNDGDEQPFFLYLAYDTPHAALQLPTIAYPGWNSSDDDDRSGMGVTGGVQWLGTPGAMINTATGTIDSYRHPDYTTGVGNSWTDVEERFATLVRRMDDNIGDLRQTLEDLGIADNTLIVFTSDNGPHQEDYLSNAQTNDNSNYAPTSFDSYGPFEGTKRDCWEGGIREPSLVCWPNTIPSGTVTTQHSQFHDWLPTFCEVAGVEIPARTDGVSLLPTLTDPANPAANGQETPTTYIEYSTGGSTANYGDFSNHGGKTRTQAQVIFIDDYKGIRNNPANANVDFAIYDTIADPDEGNNLAGTSTYFNTLQQRMKDRVLQIRQPDSSAPRSYDSAPVPVPLDLPLMVQGLNYQTYSGLWPWVPDFTQLAPTASGEFAAGIDLSVLPDTANDDGLLITGYLNVPATGTWTFSLTSDSGAFLRIHEMMVVDDDYNHDGSKKTGTALLQSGLHPFRIYYKNSNSSPPALDFTWSGPGQAEETVPASAFFTEGTPGPIPVTTDDSANTSATSSSATPVVISPLANDLDDGAPQPLSLLSFTQPVNGSVTRSGNDLTYTPALGFYGTESFGYTITDGENEVDATITVTTVFEADDIWIPLNECGGSSVSRATGMIVGSLSDGAVRSTGVHGNALSFDGSSSEFALPGLTGLPTGSTPRTIMAWIRVPSGESTENQGIFGYGNNSNGQRYTFRLNGSSDSNSPGTPQQGVRLEVQGGNIIGQTKVDDGQWHHIAVVSFDAVQNSLIYVDGVLDNIANSAPQPIMTAAGGAAVLGGSNHAAGFSFLGEIDELRLYPRALSQNEIQSIRDATQQVPAAWHRQYFGNEPLTSWLQDSDNDSLNRLAEYAFGGNPRVRDADLVSPAIIFNPASGKLEATFRRRNPANQFNLNYTVEASRDLVDWNTLTTEEVSANEIDPQNCLEEVTFESTSSTMEENIQFSRIKVELEP